MCQRSVFSKSCSRLAEQVQLKAEEEFMLEALKIIKQQRNCLQIERLNLESLKQQLKNPVSCKENHEQAMDPEQSKESTSQTHYKPTELLSAVDMMAMGRKRREDSFTHMDADMQCNNQELNLNLASTSCSSPKKPKFSDYDYNSDDDSSSDGSDGDNVMIDINMLMNGTAGNK